MIKVNGKEYGIEEYDGLISNLVENGDLEKVGENSFIWSKKHFIKMVLSMSKLTPLTERMPFYSFALKLKLMSNNSFKNIALSQ